MKLRHAVALVAICVAGCGVSAQTTSGNIHQINPGMTREEVLAKLGYPPPPGGAMVDGILTNENYDCDISGQILAISEGWKFSVDEFGEWVHRKELRELRDRSRVCVVNYDPQGRVVSAKQGSRAGEFPNSGVRSAHPVFRTLALST